MATNLDRPLDLSLSVVTGGEAAATLECLKSLYTGLDDRVTVEVFLIDNLAPEGLVQTVATRFPDVTVLKNAERLGFASNHNQALRLSKGRYHLILNDDTVLPQGFCSDMVRFADQHPGAGIFGPKIVHPDGGLQRSVYRFPSPFLALVEALFLHRLLPPNSFTDNYRSFAYDRVRKVDYLIGAALLVRREVIDNVGLMDERFFMYAEETDWCLRATKAGWDCLFIPDVSVIHVGGLSTAAIPVARQVEILKSHSYLIRKHYGLHGLLVYRIFAFLKHFPRLGLSLFTIMGDKFSREAETNYVLWCLGLLRKPGIQDTLCNQPG